MVRQIRNGFLGFAAFALLLGSSPASSASFSAKHVLSVKSGYLDSHFAVSPNGHYLSYLHFEPSGKAFLIIRYLHNGSKRLRARVNVSNFLRVQLTRTPPYRFAAIPPARVTFTPDSQYVMLIKAVTASRRLPLMSAMFFGVKNGAIKGRLPKFNHFTFRKSKLVTYTRVKHPNPRLFLFSHDVAVHSYNGRRQSGAKLMWTDSSGVIKNKQPAWTIAYWTPSLTKVMCKVPGKYDRKRDMRLPPRARIYDVIKRKFITDTQIGDLRAWADTTKLRDKQPTPGDVLLLTGTQKQPKFTRVGPVNKRVAAQQPNPPLKRFDFSTFTQQATPGGKTIHFGLTIDPQWPTLFGRNINVPQVFHLFQHDVKANATTLLGTIKSPKQWLAWSYGGRYLAVMRLHKHWKLGHRSIEIFELSR